MFDWIYWVVDSLPCKGNNNLWIGLCLIELDSVGLFFDCVGLNDCGLHSLQRQQKSSQTIKDQAAVIELDCVWLSWLSWNAFDWVWLCFRCLIEWLSDSVKLCWMIDWMIELNCVELCFRCLVIRDQWTCVVWFRSVWNIFIIYVENINNWC